MAAAAAPREPAIQTNRRLHVLHVSGPTTGGEVYTALAVSGWVCSPAPATAARASSARR